LEEATVEMIVQVNGKVRARIEMPKDADKETAQAKALANEHVQKFIEGKEIKKVIVVPNHIVNIVVK
jgi:leucyl-tRNA synthetase